MKRSISLLSTLAFVLVFSGSVFGQGSATVTASADVVSSLNATKVQDVNFGLIQDNITTEPTINTDGTASTGDIADNTNTQPGYVTITAEGGQTIQVTIPSTLQLTNSASVTDNDELTFTPQWEVVDGKLLAGNTASGSGTTNNGTATATMPSDGNGTIIIGGTLAENGGVTNRIDGGTYENTFDVTIDYSF